MWIFVRPQYREAIINERTTIVSQLQEYSLKRADQIVRNWLNSVNYMAEDIASTPAETQSIVTKTINLTPGLMRISLTEEGASESFDVRRSIYNEVNFDNIQYSWYPSRLDAKINISWSYDDVQQIYFLVAQRVIQIGDNLFTIKMFFNASDISEDLINIPLGGNYVANIVTGNGDNIVPTQPFEFPSHLVGDASYSNQTQIKLNEQFWFILTSRSQTMPFWHVIAVEDSFILKPVHDLITFSIIVGLLILITLFSFSWYVSIRVNKPVEQLISDVEHMSALDFDHPIKGVDLPEFTLMRETLENIRLTLNRYQKLNVEKIILEEWKNRYMMTYSEDLIGILNESKKFSFLNKNFHSFLEGLSLDPKTTDLDDIIQHGKVTAAKFEQNTHYPDPYTIKINRFELSVYINEDNSDYYDFQHISIVDKDGKEQAALIIMHDKTEDRLNEIKRNDMINIIVHELKNPITGVIGLSKIMLDNPNIKKDEQEVLLKEVNLSGERMNNLVNRFLDIQRLESGRIAIDFENVNMLKVVEEVCSVTHPLLNDKNLKTRIIQNGSNFVVSANRDFAFDAIQNLLSNAIKYGGPNRTIEIELENAKENLRVSVTDYGSGISLEDQKKVFDKFYRIKGNKSSEKGTGLGLAYVREIMHRHNGEIELKSEKEFGSRFTLVFPKHRIQKDTHEEV
jgi:signal transduction histidine kinase